MCGAAGVGIQTRALVVRHITVNDITFNVRTKINTNKCQMFIKVDKNFWFFFSSIKCENDFINVEKNLDRSRIIFLESSSLSCSLFPVVL